MILHDSKCFRKTFFMLETENITNNNFLRNKKILDNYYKYSN